MAPLTQRDLRMAPLTQPSNAAPLTQPPLTQRTSNPGQGSSDGTSNAAERTSNAPRTHRYGLVADHEQSVSERLALSARLSHETGLGIFGWTLGLRVPRGGKRAMDRFDARRAETRKGGSRFIAIRPTLSKSPSRRLVALECLRHGDPRGATLRCSRPRP